MRKFSNLGGNKTLGPRLRRPILPQISDGSERPINSPLLKSKKAISGDWTEKLLAFNFCVEAGSIYGNELEVVCLLRHHNHINSLNPLMAHGT